MTMHDSSRRRIEDEDTRRRKVFDGLSVVDILEFCLLVFGNLTGRGSLPHGRKLLLPLLQDGGDSTRGDCIFPIKNVGSLQGKNKERGVSLFSQGIKRF